MFEILATVPLLISIGIGAGAAQADWMGDGFIIGLVIVCPTALAVVISTVGSAGRIILANAQNSG